MFEAYAEIVTKRIANEFFKNIELQAHELTKIK